MVAEIPSEITYLRYLLCTINLMNPGEKIHTSVRKSVFVVSFYNSLLLGSKAFVPARKEIKVQLKRPKYNLKVNLEES